jgi:hypothetical protein
MGDFAGIGLGFKNSLAGFDLSCNINTAKTFELQYNSVFAAVDISILKIEGGWVFDSNYLVDAEKYSSPGRGFYISVQGMIPVYLKKGDK